MCNGQNRKDEYLNLKKLEKIPKKTLLSDMAEIKILKLSSVKSWTHTPCPQGRVGWVWGSGLQTDKHLSQSPFTGHFLDDDILQCLL
jgi:hypothetical protein